MGLISLYIYIENFINLVRDHWTDLNTFHINVPLVTLYQDCSNRKEGND